MADVELPQAVLDLLRKASRIDGDGAQLERDAQALLDEYAPKKETLADVGTIAWGQIWRDERGQWSVVHHPGIMINNEMHFAPEPEGIDPRALLNEGWHVRSLEEAVELRMEIGWETVDGEIQASSYVDFERHLPRSGGLIVLCRPDKEEAEES